MLSLYRIVVVIAIEIKSSFFNSTKVVECGRSYSLNQPLSFIKEEVAMDKSPY